MFQNEHHFQQVKVLTSHITPTYSKKPTSYISQPLIEGQGHLKKLLHLLIFTKKKKKIVTFETKIFIFGIEGDI